ncbi:hypothetical protein JW707_01915 [Candidatus Woesearchaeota archaeon]|nr:hypothetical protein [Candidatus Woesearchaeota archaeon]
MKRKLVKQGAATLMVSLPAKWLKLHKMGKGGEVDLEEVDDKLVISSGALETKPETKIRLIELTESSIRTLITNTYRSGFDRIYVEFENENQFKVLSKVLKTRLVGFEVVKKEKNRCVVENITEPTAEQFDTIIHKIFFNVSEIFSITKSRMNGSKDAFDFDDVEERIQKYDNFCRRVISKREHRGPKSEFLWTFLALIVHGQREIFHLNKALEGVKVSQKTKELLEGSSAMFELIKKAYFEKKIELLAEVHKMEKDLIYIKGYSLLQKAKGKEAVIVYHLMTSIREFYLANSPLCGLIF